VTVSVTQVFISNAVQRTDWLFSRHYVSGDPDFCGVLTSDFETVCFSVDGFVFGPFLLFPENVTSSKACRVCRQRCTSFGN